MIQNKGLYKRIEKAFALATRNADLLTQHEIEVRFVNAFAHLQKSSALVKFFWYDYDDADIDSVIDFVMDTRELNVLRYATYVATDMDLTLFVIEYNGRAI